ncbi:MAG: hypothetical protein NVSMB21_03770 [Vulcanimicrobiaceae bacterium]
MPRLSVTVILVLVNVVVYAWQVASGTEFESSRSLVEHGALLGILVTQYGEWWRVVSGGFEHGGLAHIALNMFALFQLGRFVETLLGPGRMLAVYVISLVGGGYAVASFAPNDVTVGASGAIFGLFGALLGVGVRMGRPGRALISQTLPTLAINLAFTFAVPFISKAGHLGGLASGFAAGLLFYAMRPRVAADVAVVDHETGIETEAEYLPPPAAPHA